jgi:hypothetical protein
VASAMTQRHLQWLPGSYRGSRGSLRGLGGTAAVMRLLELASNSPTLIQMFDRSYPPATYICP